LNHIVREYSMHSNSEEVKMMAFRGVESVGKKSWIMKI
jgi:hypothetical protein